jgi:hypothetical protein
MLGLLRPIAGQARPAGERRPTTGELAAAGNATMDEMRRRSPQRAAEAVVEFDHRAPGAESAPPFMYSYLESLAVDAIETFTPYVRRAEESARAHQALFATPSASSTPFVVAHRARSRTTSASPWRQTGARRPRRSRSEGRATRAIASRPGAARSRCERHVPAAEHAEPRYTRASAEATPRLT